MRTNAHRVKKFAADLAMSSRGKSARLRNCPAGGMSCTAKVVRSDMKGSPQVARGLPPPATKSACAL